VCVLTGHDNAILNPAVISGVSRSPTRTWSMVKKISPVRCGSRGYVPNCHPYKQYWYC